MRKRTYHRKCSACGTWIRDEGNPPCQVCGAPPDSGGLRFPAVVAAAVAVVVFAAVFLLVS